MRFYQKKESVKKVQRREGDYVKNPFMRAGIENLSAYFAFLVKTNAYFVCKKKRNMRLLAKSGKCAASKNQNTNLILACIACKPANFFINYYSHIIIVEVNKNNMINKMEVLFDDFTKFRF